MPIRTRNAMTERLRRVTRALLSVSDKTGLVDFARALPATASSWSRPAAPPRRSPTPASRCATSSDLTGFPEMMDGRVKTLHPKVHGGLLAIRDNAEHAAAMAAARHRADRPAGGQSLSVRGDRREGRRLRRLHREHRHRRPGDDPRRGEEPRRRRRGGRCRRLRARCSAELAAHGGATTLALRKALAAEGLCAHRRLRRRDLQLVRARSSARPRRPTARSAASSPRRCATARTRTRRAAFYRAPEQRSGVATARQVQGKQLSYNNINDTDAAYECVAEFDPDRTAGLRDRQARQPVRRRRRRRPRRRLPQGAAPAIRPRRSAASSRSTARSTREAARAITEIFTEVIIAPDADRRGDRDRRREEEPAPAARRRPARSARAGLDGEIGRRRPAGAVARQRGGRRDAAQGRDQARADARPSSPTCASRSASPST